MKLDLRLFLIAEGEGTVWDLLCALPSLAVSGSARIRYREFQSVSKVLRFSMSAPDDTITIRVNRGKSGLLKPSGTLILLVVLFGIATFEWGYYTLPALREWLVTVGHKCGIYPR